MGMDVYGKKPTSQEGEYFRSNVWYWHPLWAMIEDFYPQLAAKVPNAHYNDGDGLNAEDSLILASLLKIDLENGNVQSYVDLHEYNRQNFPDVPCNFCSETGQRILPQEDGSAIQKECTSCNGTGMMKDFATHYPMHIDVIKEFATFVEHSGGFSIC